MNQDDMNVQDSQCILYGYMNKDYLNVQDGEEHREVLG